MEKLHKQEYIEELVAKLSNKVLTEEFECYVYGMDWSPRTVEEIYPPDVVICPKTTEDIVIAVKIAYKYGIPVTVGGGLTGMAGGAVPVYGGIYIDSTTMNGLIEIAFSLAANCAPPISLNWSAWICDLKPSF